MRKGMALVVAVCVLLSGTMAFAEGKTQEKGAGTGIGPIQEMRMLAERVGPLAEEIRANRQEMLSLREQVREACLGAQEAVREMIQNRQELRLEQVEALRDSMERIRESRRVLAGTVGEIEGEMSRFREHVRNRNREDAAGALENCIRVQNLRMEELRKALAELEEIESI